MNEGWMRICHVTSRGSVQAWKLSPNLRKAPKVTLLSNFVCLLSYFYMSASVFVYVCLYFHVCFCIFVFFSVFVYVCLYVQNVVSCAFEGYTCACVR